jgi:FKBP12-rapamycin complex-associated protein
MIHSRNWSGFRQRLEQLDDFQALLLDAIAKCVRHEDRSVELHDVDAQLARIAGPKFWQGYNSVLPWILRARMITELGETSARWRERLKVTTVHYSALREVLDMRLELAATREEQEVVRPVLISLARHANEWTVHETELNRWFGAEERPIWARFEDALRLWRDDRAGAMRVVEELSSESTECSPQLRARMCRKLAAWHIADGAVTQAALRDVRELCTRACSLREGYVGAMRLLAWASMKLLSAEPELQASAIIGFAKCAALSGSFGDVLQMMALLVDSDGAVIREAELRVALMAVPERTFLKIFPQLIAYEGRSSGETRKFILTKIQQLVCQAADETVFGFMFVMQFGTPDDDLRQVQEGFTDFFWQAAKSIRDGLELICTTASVFVLEGCERFLRGGDAQRLRRVVERVLERLCKPQGQYDTQFCMKFRNEIEQNFRRYQANPSQDIGTIRNACCKSVADIRKHLDTETSLSIAAVAPELPRVPGGIVRVFHQRVMIESFEDRVFIQPSKQKPRKIKIRGSDGRRYRFLLKGCEDLRLDARVIQLFDLVNSFRGMAKIVSPGVTPLSPSSGLVQWIPHCKTLYELIATHRRIAGQRADDEIDRMADAVGPPRGVGQVSNNINAMTSLRRLEALQQVFAHTRADDLREILWLSERDAESWARHHAQFSKTLAVTSILGYVIGLGDRHPSNLLFDGPSGAVVHIDFGECFESTRERPPGEHPELVPFRFTRQLRTALGPHGFGGSFTVVCEQTIRAMRRHRESLLDVLEIFHLEPITNGRLFEADDMDVESQRRKVESRMARVRDKLLGTDFVTAEPLTPRQQLAKLIEAATDEYALARLYHGWAPCF